MQRRFEQPDMSCQLPWPQGRLRYLLLDQSAWALDTQTSSDAALCVPGLHTVSDLFPPHRRFAVQQACLQRRLADCCAWAACGLPFAWPTVQQNFKKMACRWVERVAAGEPPNDRKMRRNLECILDGKRLVVYGELESPHLGCSAELSAHQQITSSDALPW